MAPDRSPLPTLALVTEGDAESADRSFSGTANMLLTNLRRLGHTVWAVDAELYGAARALLAARLLSPDRARWRTRFRLGAAAFAARSRKARAGVRALPARPDVVVQIGATFAPPVAPGARYALFCDWNQRLAARHVASGQSPVSHMTPAEAAGVEAREAAVYRDAAAIFTISERLRQSFVQDYGVPADRVVVTYPGPNMELSRIPERALARGDGATPAGPPTILFVGKDFVRKGGDTLLAAFARVRGRVPAARLVVVGPTDVGPLPPGVELLGPLRKEEPAEWERLVRAYAEADVFCLPTRYEPLGIVVIEAMYFGLPCVTSDTWAMPEMVADGETGHVVPVDDVAAFAARLGDLLGDRALARRMGEAGRRRALERFSWAAAARTVGERLAAIVAARGGAAPAGAVPAAR